MGQPGRLMQAFAGTTRDGENKLPPQSTPIIGLPQRDSGFVNFPGNDGDVFQLDQHRRRALGVTYALGEERKTLIRGSFSHVRRAPCRLIGNVSPDQPRQWSRARSFVFIDNPGGFDGFYDDGEQYSTLGGASGASIRQRSDGALNTAANVNDPNMDPPMTSELIHRCLSTPSCRSS